MEITIVTFGKIHADFIRRGIEEYEGRLRQRNISFSVQVLPDVKKKGKSLDISRQKDLEGEAMALVLKGNDYVILFDERGKELTSEQFAQELQHKMASGLRRLVFCIGGPYGFSQKIYDRANALLALSKMTFSHEMARLFATEQIYRAFTILNGDPYHHR